MPKLTARERELVQAISEGLSNRLIASRLGIAEQSIKNRLTVVFEKFGVSSRLQLAVVAARQEWFGPVDTHQAVPAMRPAPMTAESVLVETI